MYFFFHLLTGLVIGLVLAMIFDESCLILVGMAASVFPDLLDKCLAFVFPALNSGRTFGHTMIFLMVVVVVLAIIAVSYNPLVATGVVIAYSVLFHQIFDAVWVRPASWLYPFLGEFYTDGWMVDPATNTLSTGFIAEMYYREITNPSEWACAIITVSIIIVLIMKWRKDKNESKGSPTDTP